jgi:peptidyl-prolyl cis-trans isomerase C
MMRVVVLLLAFGLAACQQQTDSGVLASVSDKQVDKKEFETYLAYKRIAAEKGHKRYDNLLEQYLEREALADAIEEQALLDPEMVRVELNEFRKEMLISRYFEKFLQDKVTDDAVSNYYASHPELYEETKVHVAHILLRTRQDMDEAERQAKLTTIQEVASKLAAGEEFEALAKQYSEDKVSARKGGSIGWIETGSVDDKFSDIAFGLEPGEHSEPFHTPFGFHIVKQLEAPKTIKRPFDAVKGEIRHQLRVEAKNAELERLLETAEIEKQ